MLRLISKYIKDVNKLVFVFETQQPNESYFDYEIIESLKQTFIGNKTDTVQTSPHSI